MKINHIPTAIIRLCTLSAALFSGFMTVSASAREYTNVAVEKLMVSSTTYTGQPLSYLKTGQPEVTALLVRVPPGGETGWHQHPVPVYAYMLEGELTVAMKDGKRYRFGKGEVILEVQNILHNGYNSGAGEASLVVFYTGATGVPNVVKEVGALPQTAPSGK